MFIGILTRNKDSWCSKKIIEAFEARNVKTFPFKLQDIVCNVGFEPKVLVGGLNVKDFDAILVRPLGPGSLDEILFRVDTLHRIARLGVTVINNPQAIENAANKYFTLSLLEDAGIKVPKTVVTENVREAIHAFPKLNGEVVIKPIFGSKGLGITKTSDVEVASRIFRLLHRNHFVLYLQEYVKHGGKDIRCFVVGERVIASMYRVAKGGWKTNVSQGGVPVPFKPSKETEELAVKAAKTVGCEIAGVDLMESKEGLMVHEVNSQPGFMGLQTSTGIDIAGEIVDYIIKKIKS
ncbi:MAG: hypothetical protein DRO36_05405 [Candidatus Hecatellales archaeon]|nr:MAG: hypothetical protein DRO36_05405 [Candidatus Hecatellales archaeon]